MTSQEESFLFVAVHKGPYLSIQPLEEELGANRVTYLVDGVSKEDRVRHGLPFLDLGGVNENWGSLDAFIKDMRVRAVIRSTSEDVPGDNVEELVSLAALKVRVPVFVVEDYPGNYWRRPGEGLDGLFVEDETLTKLHSSRGVNPDIIYSTGNPRYNVLSSFDSRSARLETRRVLGLGDEQAVLWAGQPDGDNSYLALERLLRHVGETGATLLFRAHPRDEAYAGGKYSGLLGRVPMRVVDVSDYPQPFGLYSSSDLVVTQFSSAGVEASHLGIPTLFVLFDDLGKEYLRAFKGYESLPWCNDGCSFLIEREEEIGDVLDRALFDTRSREAVRLSFRNRFGAGSRSAPAIANRIRSKVCAGI